ncbi:MAG: FtsX-like permease family protein, partial [Spirochaetota bacterium]
MMREFKIPFFLVIRYLKHGNKWTLSLIIVLMSIAFINLVFVTSLFNGIIESSNNQVINTYTGHIMMMPLEGEELISNEDSVMERILATDGVVSATPQFFVPGRISYKKISGNWQIIAVDPSLESKVMNIHENMISGSFLEDEDLDQVIIGRQIAGGEEIEMNAVSFKGAKVGEKVTLSLHGIEKEFTIKGIFYTKFIDTDLRVFVSRKAIEKMIPHYKKICSNINIRITHTGDERKVISNLEKGITEGVFNTWKDVAGFMDSITESFGVINTLMTMVGMMIAAVTIFIVIYVDISSKRQEIGVLRAIGIKPYLIRMSFVLQSIVYSFMGVVL